MQFFREHFAIDFMQLNTLSEAYKSFIQPNGARIIGKSFSR